MVHWRKRLTPPSPLPRSSLGARALYSPPPPSRPLQPQKFSIIRNFAQSLENPPRVCRGRGLRKTQGRFQRDFQDSQLDSVRRREPLLIRLLRHCFARVDCHWEALPEGSRRHRTNRSLFSSPTQSCRSCKSRPNLLPHSLRPHPSPPSHPSRASPSPASHHPPSANLPDLRSRSSLRRAILAREILRPRNS